MSINTDVLNTIKAIRIQEHFMKTTHYGEIGLMPGMGGC